VFSFKHDLEALLLASEEALFRHLGMERSRVKWKVPVEDQDHDCPPKRIVEQLFEEAGKRYRDTVDAPRILKACSYLEIAERCDQAFKPFVQFLIGL
jgi:hypothetical protein